MTTDLQTITLGHERYVILPEGEYRALVEDGETCEPSLPSPDARGYYPAVEAARVLLARKIIRRRRALGLRQADLAKLARVRVETISRLEHAKHSPNVATVDKIDRALSTKAAEAAEATRPPAAEGKAKILLKAPGRKRK